MATTEHGYNLTEEDIAYLKAHNITSEISRETIIGIVSSLALVCSDEAEDLITKITTSEEW